MNEPGRALQAAMTEQIRVELTMRQWTQADLCTAAGINGSTLHRYLAGTRDIPVPVCVEIARALSLSWVELLSRAEERLAK